MGVSVGYWQSCMGCDECKGKGVVFHPWTKAMQEDFARMAMEK